MSKIAIVRLVKISNVVGRSEYINKVNRLEKPLFQNQSHESITWKQIHDFEVDNVKTNSMNNEARELIIALPRKLDKDHQKCQELIDQFCEEQFGKNRKWEYSVEWNKEKTNLHAHILFSEREINFEVKPKIYKKDLWVDEKTGKTCKANQPGAILRFKKGEVQKDKDGNVKYNENLFSEKNKKFKEKSWLENCKNEYKNLLNSYGFDYRLFDKTIDIKPTIHVGAERAKNNQLIEKKKEYNKYVLNLRSKAQNKAIERQNKFNDISLEEKAKFVQNGPKNVPQGLIDIKQQKFLQNKGLRYWAIKQNIQFLQDEFTRIELNQEEKDVRVLDRDILNQISQLLSKLLEDLMKILSFGKEYPTWRPIFDEYKRIKNTQGVEKAHEYRRRHYKPTYLNEGGEFSKLEEYRKLSSQFIDPNENPKQTKVLSVQDTEKLIEHTENLMKKYKQASIEIVYTKSLNEKIENIKKKQMEFEKPQQNFDTKSLINKLKNGEKITPTQAKFLYKLIKENQIQVSPPILKMIVRIIQISKQISR